MNTEETTNLLKIRRDLTGETFNNGTIEAWTEALTGWTLKQCRTALITASRDHQPVAVRHVVQHLPPPRGNVQPREEHICIRCGMAPAELLHTRCEPCQAIVHQQIRDGIQHSPAMTEALHQAHKKQQP